MAALRIARRIAPAMGRCRRLYWGHNRIEDLYMASDAWHRLQPQRKLGDESALRKAFDSLDLDGSGTIDKFELKSALLAILADTAPSGMVDDNVDAMFEWADLDSDGQIDYEEYKRIIHAGCLPDGHRVDAKTKAQSSAARVATAGMRNTSETSDT